MTIQEVRYWALTGSADHATTGRALGIVQVCHGKVALLGRSACCWTGLT
ncbi:EVE domain-containing protein [Gemmobacter lutimaris]|nr:hypothetical protein [Gemmobacter lutimaris]